MNSTRLVIVLTYVFLRIPVLSYREEGRGRRLFSPANSKSSFSFTALEIAASSSSSRSLNVILEATDELTTVGLSPCKSPLATANLNIRSPDQPPSSLALRCASPTLNLILPNFVIDGEAPHLVNVLAASGGSERADGVVVGQTNGSTVGEGSGSGGGGGGGVAVKRKLREHIDWLTKIRKQKQLQAAKGIENSYGTAMERVTASQLLSPRLQQLKSCGDEGGGGGGGGGGTVSSGSGGLGENKHQQQETNHLSGNATSSSSSETPTTPRRRSSWAWNSSSSPHGEHGDDIGQLRGTRTTLRSRRYSTNGMRGVLPVTSETASIRRFLTVTTPTSRTNAQASN